MVNKKIVLIIVVIIAFVLIFYWQINLIFFPKYLSQSECQEKINKWCNDCFSANNKKTDVWNNPGTKIGEQLSKCSVNYFQTDWTAEQDCTGNAIDYCLPQIDLPIE